MKIRPRQSKKLGQVKLVSKLCEDKTKTEQETRASETSELIL